MPRPPHGPVSLIALTQTAKPPQSFLLTPPVASPMRNLPWLDPATLTNMTMLALSTPFPVFDCLSVFLLCESSLQRLPLHFVPKHALQGQSTKFTGSNSGLNAFSFQLFACEQRSCQPIR
jgi:hypothetical protein